MTFSPIEVAAYVSLAFVMIAFFITFFRLAIGPSTPDRIVALDLFTVLTIGMIVSYIFLTKQVVFLYAAVILALIAFLGTVAYARFLEKRVL